MARLVSIQVTPFYHTLSGDTIRMRSEFFHLHVPSRLSKSVMAENGRILRSVNYFSRFDNFSLSLLRKICFRIEIIEASNSKSYSTFFAFPKNI